MVRADTLLRRLLCLALAVIMIVPAVGSSAHALSHGRTDIAATGHHAAPAGTGHQDGTPDKRDGGHDHQLSLSVPVAILFGETPLVHPPLAAPAAPEMRVKRLALRAAEPPPADPPRFS